MPWVFMLATSEPVLGSVIAKKPSCVPATQPGTYFFFCAALPTLLTVSAGPRFCMLNGSRQDADTLPICSAISTDSMNPMPLPPSSSGTAQEKNPRPPILATRSGRNSCLRSSSSSVGAICSAAKRRAVSWISRWSSVRSKSISLDHEEDRVFLDLVAFLHAHLLHGAGAGRIHQVLHLERLDHEQLVVLLHLRARLDEHVEDVA